MADLAVEIAVQSLESGNEDEAVRGSSWTEEASVAFLCYALIGVRAFHWIWWTVRALEYAETYKAELPYLLRLAEPSDWTLLLAIGVTLACWVGFAFSTSPRASLP